MSENVPVKESGNLKEAKQQQYAAEHDIQRGYLGPTPTVSQLPPRGERLWIDRPERLLSAVRELKRSKLVAIDAEFTQARSHSLAHSHSNGARSIPRLALLQLAIDHQCYVVDALRLHDLSPLTEIISDPGIPILLHGAGGDIRVMAERGLDVVHYYDLEATCRSIFGQHESSLATMLQRAFQMHLDKTLQRTDWTRRPLPPAMIAYAARDAEVTLALYHWLDRHYHTILQLHETTSIPDPVAPWIEPFLSGTSTTSPEFAIAEAKSVGLIQHASQITTDCHTALAVVTHPLRRNRLLRLISDLSLARLAPDIIPLLQAPTADERSGSARTLGRLGIKSATEQIRSLLYDPVYDVRKAAWTALQLLDSHNNKPRQGSIRPATRKNADGTRSWVVESANDSENNHDQRDWKARLRSMVDD